MLMQLASNSLLTCTDLYRVKCYDHFKVKAYLQIYYFGSFWFLANLGRIVTWPVPVIPHNNILFIREQLWFGTFISLKASLSGIVCIHTLMLSIVIVYYMAILFQVVFFVYSYMTCSSCSLVSRPFTQWVPQQSTCRLGPVSRQRHNRNNYCNRKHKSKENKWYQTLEIFLFLASVAATTCFLYSCNCDCNCIASVKQA